MTAKKPATTRKRVSSPQRTASVIDKYGAILKLFANYGAAGLFGGYLLIVTLPDAQKSFTAAIEKQAEQNREDRKNAFTHGENAIQRLSTSLDNLRTSFSTVQSVTQGNQRALIEEQKRTNEILETKMGSPKDE